MSHRHTIQARPWARRALALCLATLLAAAAAAADAATPKRSSQATFATPHEAAEALIQAARDKNEAALRRILGPGAGRVISSGDPAQDERTRLDFLAAAGEAAYAEGAGEDKATLLIGQRAWPLPFPLVRDAQQRWRFDTRAGLQEFLDRQIGANELATLQAVRAYVDAQREYVLRDRNRDGLLEYAQQIVSSEGRRDGLYWPPQPGQGPSPLGAALGAAETTGLRPASGAPQPYHGYHFRVLKAQGADAPGGAFSYLVGTRMIGGFALVAYPARWGVSGVMSFIVNHHGIVYSRNLGRDTARVAAALTTYDPGPGWSVEAGAQDAAAAPASLAGTHWRLPGAPSDPRMPQELKFGEDGRVAGSDGCNRLIGTYTTQGDRLRLGPLAASRRACLGLGGRDAAFQRALQTVARWRIDGRKLELLSDDGAVALTFEPASS